MKYAPTHVGLASLVLLGTSIVPAQSIEPYFRQCDYKYQQNIRCGDNPLTCEPRRANAEIERENCYAEIQRLVDRVIVPQIRSRFPYNRLDRRHRISLPPAGDPSMKK